MIVLALVSVSAWQQILPVPSLPPASPEDQTTVLFLRSLGLNLATLAGVGLLGYLLAGELQRTEASLATERRVVADLVSLHQDIVRSLTSGLVTVDLRGRVLSVNHHAAELLDAADAIGGDVDAILPGLHARLDSVAPEGSLRRADLSIPIDGKTLVLGISVSPLRDQQDVVVGRVINFTDLSELRRMEQQVKHAERMATIGQLAAGIAHEIRNPLASMSGSIELLQHAPAASDDDRALMAIVIREIDRLNALINDLLDYASPRPRQAVTFDFAVMIRETVQVFRQDRGFGGVDVTVEAPEHVELTADPAKLRQVVWNLLRNAAEAAASGGGHVKVTVRVADDAAIVEIADDGPGIAKDVLARVFDPFFTTKQKGTGLGLATCQNVVGEHGGTITVSSEPDAGTRFVVTLPRDRTSHVDAVLPVRG
jgi:two-component system sensor histidine kinase PilS (NtrC family)